MIKKPHFNIEDAISDYKDFDSYIKMANYHLETEPATLAVIDHINLKINRHTDPNDLVRILGYGWIIRFKFLKELYVK